MKRLLYTLILLNIFILSGCEEENVAEKEIKLDYYIQSFDIADLGFKPEIKVTYTYDESGKLQKYSVLSYNPNTTTFEELRYFVFTYSNNKVEDIKGYLPNATSPYIEYTYQYLPNHEVSKITETNLGTGINSEANFTYAENGTVKVYYTYSNGGSFEYEFDYASKNILSDKTTRGSQLCSDGQYSYDQYNNPFKDLDYIDYQLTNISVNNKLTENVNYIGCAFPSLIPESFTYEYNDKGYPTSATTFYKSQGSVKKSKKEFFYRSE